jgi:hypothetical protein
MVMRELRREGLLAHPAPTEGAREA